MTTATQQTETEVTEQITRWIAARGTSRAHIYKTAGISRQTFERSMKGQRSFTLRELSQIAEALGTPLTRLITGDYAEPAYKVAA